MSRLHERIASGVVVAAMLAAVAAPAHAAITRGPYLQLGTDQGVVVRWRTDTASVGRVRYAVTAGGVWTTGATVDEATSRTNHEVALSGLAPDTRYYYAVGTTAGTLLAGDDASTFFVTSPVPGTPKPTRVWVLGDSGTADSNARAVRDAYITFSGARHTDLWLMLGDNAYSSGTDSEYQAAVFDTYPTMLRKSVLWPTLGNHDGASADSGSQSGVYYDIFSLPRDAEAGGVASGTEAYYSFDYGNIHFVVLDSFDSSRSATGPMLNWLRSDLAATARDWVIAFWHHPPYSKGSHDSDSSGSLTDMRQNAVPILEGEGVDLVLCGHSHSYERSFLIDGHYATSSTFSSSMMVDGGDGRPAGSGAYEKPTLGPAPHEGAVYTVAGSSGKTSGGSLNHPAMYISLNVLGSVVLDVNGSRLDATFLGSNGAVLDSFTIEKGGGCSSAATVDVLPTSPSLELGVTVQLTATPRNAGGDGLAGCLVTWSSDTPAVASVSATGLVTGIEIGSATISAASGTVAGTAAVTVTPSTNQAPSLGPVPALASAEGTVVTLAVSFGDPDASDSHTATIGWGDGSPSQAGTVDESAGTITANHVYADNGSYAVTVTVYDNRGGFDEDGGSATVSNVPPTAIAGGPYSGFVGSAIAFSGSATDPGADALSFEWDFDYDGVTFGADASGATAQHAYSQQGSHTVALRVSDDDGGWSLATAGVSVAAAPSTVLYFSLGSRATVGGLSVANEDIVAFDGGSFSLYFDGSDVGLASFTIDAFAVISPSEILLSFTSAGTVGGVSIDDSDVVKFTATSLGPSTAGSFSLYFDGSDVGLSTSDEDVDAVEVLPNGHLLVSTTGSFSVAGLSGADEDLLEFTPASLGPNTAGTWSLYFDGSDVGLTDSAEDVDGLAVDGSGRIYLSATGSFSVSGRSGADEDVFVFTPSSLGPTTSGTFSPTLFFDGSAYGLGSNDVYAIDLP